MSKVTYSFSEKLVEIIQGKVADATWQNDVSGSGRQVLVLTSCQDPGKFLKKVNQSIKEYQSITGDVTPDSFGVVEIQEIASGELYEYLFPEIMVGDVTIYVTFGQKYRQEPHPLVKWASPDGWVEFRGNSMSSVFSKINEILGVYYAFSYTEEEWERSGSEKYYVRGCLRVIDCNPKFSSSSKSATSA